MPPTKRQRTCDAGSADVAEDADLKADSGEELELGCPAVGGDLKAPPMKQQRQVSDASTEVPEDASCDDADWPRATTFGPIGVFDWGAWPTAELETAPPAMAAAQFQGATGHCTAPKTMREILELPLAAF
eukprot:CAMPEP_0168372554 /NCGR_PEP_ID=MMETSP0228-20121227/8340_1 /TAXON_ID=133427 /ORGANISM="Protoceratium reticulatum, Strain CCCM 535 (=CCMP 1889)" /LENGTH=129 /DNA_ID=CAMNT_0008385463 /DNA_START=81 /DNA_END=470 /DNA_ORIENTATION=-